MRLCTYPKAVQLRWSGREGSRGPGTGESIVRLMMRLMKETTMQSSLRDSTNLSRESLEKDPAVSFILDGDLRIVYCNEAWDKFAVENGGRGLERQQQRGRSVMDAVPALLKQLFEGRYRKVLSSRQAWEHCYECSSPTVYRSFRMVSYPDPEGEGVVVVNSIAAEWPHEGEDRKVCAPDGMVYGDDHGTITMCCHCRRTRRVGPGAVWDWVPNYLEEPPKLISHGVCAVCTTAYGRNRVRPRYTRTCVTSKDRLGG